MKPQDVFILAKLILVVPKDEKWSYKGIAQDLSMSASEVHAGVKRLIESRLITSVPVIINTGALRDFLFHGLSYVFPVQPGRVVRGIPTSHSAPPLSNKIVAKSTYVWPCSTGKVRGESIEPLYKSVPKAVNDSPKLYQIMALLDAIRLGYPREKKLAENFLNKNYIAHAS